MNGLNHSLDLIDALRVGLSRPLPGYVAHKAMSPQPRTGTEPGYTPPVPPRRGGVLVLFYPHNGTLHLPLILRQTLTDYSGQPRTYPFLDLIPPHLINCHNRFPIKLSRIYLGIIGFNYVIGPSVR